MGDIVYVNPMFCGISRSEANGLRPAPRSDGNYRLQKSFLHLAKGFTGGWRTQGDNDVVSPPPRRQPGFCDSRASLSAGIQSSSNSTSATDSPSGLTQWSRRACTCRRFTPGTARSASSEAARMASTVPKATSSVLRVFGPIPGTSSKVDLKRRALPSFIRPRLLNRWASSRTRDRKCNSGLPVRSAMAFF